jgi:hypothetical protein
MENLEVSRCNSLGPAKSGDVWACVLPEGHDGPHDSGADQQWDTKEEMGRLRILPRSPESWSEQLAPDSNVAEQLRDADEID